MTVRPLEELPAGRLLVDLGFRDQDGLIASYLVPGPDGWSVIETGPGSCSESLRAGVRAAGIDPGEVARVFVTHIHLDHSGGLGQAAEAFPNARLFAHWEGVPHLIDPSRLIASARRAWGAAADPLWGPIPPVDAARLTGLRGGESFPVHGGELRVLATPGHARHHLSFLDTGTRSMFTGDSAGVRLRGEGSARPAVPPPDLDVELLLGSLERMAEAAPSTLLYAHYGAFPEDGRTLPAYADRVIEWRAVALAAAAERPDPSYIAERLRAHEVGTGRLKASGAGPADRGELVSGFEMAALGFLRYFRTRGLVPE